MASKLPTPHKLLARKSRRERSNIAAFRRRCLQSLELHFQFPDDFVQVEIGDAAPTVVQHVAHELKSEGWSVEYDGSGAPLIYIRPIRSQALQPPFDLACQELEHSAETVFRFAFTLNYHLDVDGRMGRR